MKHRIRKEQKVVQENPSFRWRDVPRAIWFFLDKDRGKFLACVLILFAIFFYDLVPAYIVGRVVDFFTVYNIGESLRPFYFLIVFLGVSHMIASTIRLRAKRELAVTGYHMRARARVWGFERLTEFSLQWHAKEN